MTENATGAAAGEPAFTTKRRIGIWLGAGLFLLLEALPAPEGMSVPAWHCAAVALLIATWWVTEAIPLSVTALLPVALFPILGVLPLNETVAPYAHRVVMLLLGGFIIALSMQRWGLHRRIALFIVAQVGSRPENVVGGFMLACGLVSMWVFNTTTTIMMLPIALSVIDLLRRESSGKAEHEAASRNFATALMIGVAYSATIGGSGTLIGTAPNAVLAGFMHETYGVEIGFAQWMMVGVPMVALMLPLAWLILTRVAFPMRMPPIEGHGALIRAQLAEMGPMSRGERLVSAVVGVAAFLWVFRPLINDLLPGLELNDTSIAMAAAVALFVIPVDPRKGVFMMSGEWAAKVPWGVVVLFGGGLSLAAGIKTSGLAEWIGAATSGIAALPTLAIILAIVTLIVFLTELTSNTATTSTFLPLVAGVAVGIGENPFLLVFPLVLAANCAFMMPVATPPNAVVFASGHITVAQLIRGGIWVNLVGIVVATFIAYTAVGVAFDVELGVLPEWATAGDPLSAAPAN